MIRIVTRLRDGTLRTDHTLESLRDLRAQEGADPFFWIDLEPKPEDLSKIEEFFLEDLKFHPVAVEDALKEVHIPKLDDWSDYIYMVLHMDRLVGDHHRLETREVDFFLGRRFLVTHHGDPSKAIDSVWNKINSESKVFQNGVGYLLHQILDCFVEQTRPLAHQFEDWVDEAEVEVLEAPTAETLESILGARRGLLRVRRNVRGLLQVMTRLSQENFAVVSDEDRIYFRDIEDNVRSQLASLDSTRELVTGTMDTYLSVTSNRTNEIMYTLTLLTALFMPISFLAGFFGMNFFGPEFVIHPGEVGRPLFIATMVAIVTLPPAMLVWMRWRGWL